MQGTAVPKRRSTTLCIATGLSLSAALLEAVALSTPCWIEADRRIYNNKFDKLGLLVFCFRSFTDPKRRYPQYFVSCRWFFDFEWKYMYDVLAPPFFRSVQIAFGIGFILLLGSLGQIVLLWLRSIPTKHETSLLFILSFTHAATAFWFFLAFTIFGARSSDPSWLPGWQNNYLSWSFGLSVVGGIQLFISSVLYFVEAKRHLERAIATTEEQLMASIVVPPTTVPLPPRKILRQSHDVQQSLV
ncbi:hypothetical protein BV898_09612 [Hypsibius exemplaris]|uniref:Uncharacterized protein n=1 Tax=Hypsibius exemplaris TaxID=2072580 RepID=A0A1W0WM74_HYPEX|nr:hypothetical protein BV898_09612 [Hypsibius exemplaris]